MEEVIATATVPLVRRTPWNKGKLVGAKTPLRGFGEACLQVADVEIGNMQGEGQWRWHCRHSFATGCRMG